VSYEWADFYGPLCTRKRPPFPHFSAEMLRKSIPFPIVLMQALLIYLLDFLCINYKAGSIKNMGTRHQDKHKSSASEFLAWARKVFLSFVFFRGSSSGGKLKNIFHRAKVSGAFTLTSFHNDETAQRAFSFKTAINKDHSKTAGSFKRFFLLK